MQSSSKSDERIKSLTQQFSVALIEAAANEVSLEHLQGRFQRRNNNNQPREGLLRIDLVANMNAPNNESSMRYGGFEQSASIYKPKDPSTTQSSKRWNYYPHYCPVKTPSFWRLYNAAGGASPKPPT